MRIQNVILAAVFFLIACAYLFLSRTGTYDVVFTAVAWLALGAAALTSGEDGHLSLPGYLQAGVCVLVTILGVLAAYQDGLEVSDFSYLFGIAVILYIYRGCVLRIHVS